MAKASDVVVTYTTYVDVGTTTSPRVESQKSYRRGDYITYTSKSGNTRRYPIRWVGYNKYGVLTFGLPKPRGNGLFYIPATSVI